MGGIKIFGPRRSPTGTKSDGGGGSCEKILIEAKTAHLMQNYFFAILSMKYSFLCTFELKSSQNLTQNCI